MKRITTLLLICLFAFFSSPSMGQDTTKHTRTHTDDEEYSADKEDERDPRREKPKRQQTPLPAAVGIEIGINEAWLLRDGKFQFSNFVFGWRTGAFVYVPVSGTFCIQPGLYYTTGGGEWRRYATGDAAEIWRINAVEMPLNFGFRYNGRRGRKYKRFIGIGPYVAYNLSGKYSYTSSNSSLYGSNKSGSLSIGTDKSNDIKPLGYGIGLSVSTEWRNGLYLKTRFQGGLANLSPGGYTRISDCGIGIQFGYLLGTKAPKKHYRSRDDDYIERRR